jgi:phytoene dehydrogenase-like protein
MLSAMNHADAIVVGSGPNGLAAAIVIAQAGRRVVVYEAETTFGGGARSGTLTLPGFVHDVCSAVHPMAAASPFFKTLPLAQHGLEWIEPPAQLAHPFDDHPAALIYRSVDRTAAALGSDERAYRLLVGRLASDWPLLDDTILGPPRWPRHPVAAARFGLQALRSIERVAAAFTTEPARALLGGIAAHGMLPLDRRPTAAFGLVLGALAHATGWAVPRGGAQQISNALASYFTSLGGEIVTGTRVNSIDELPPVRAILCDLSPRPLLRIAGHQLPRSYRRKLERYRYGMGVFKVDWAMDGPIPWRDADCGLSATVHLGGTFAEIAQSERDAWEGRVSERPFMILTQPTLFDPSRAPSGCHTAWAYCHVPHGSPVDMLQRIESQIERFAPGFGARVLARHVTRPSDIEQHNHNMVGGDIGAGVMDLSQLFTRPTWRAYATPVRGLYICSASTPPGVGVHGMCGYSAASLALSEVWSQ